MPQPKKANTFLDAVVLQESVLRVSQCPLNARELMARCIPCDPGPRVRRGRSRVSKLFGSESAGVTTGEFQQIRVSFSECRHTVADVDPGDV